MSKYTKEDKEALIDLIIWYRDEYHTSDWCHSEFISKIPTADDHELNFIELVVDMWID